MKDELVDFYKKMPSSMTKKYHNPCYKDHQIDLPFLAGIFGGTGAGKTQTVMNLIKRMNGTFSKIILCVRKADEPLYNYLQSKIKDKDPIEIYEDGEVPNVDDYAGFDGQILIIFDDLINKKDQKPIQEFFIRGRKTGGGISSIYCSQSYYKTPKDIRLQMNHIFIKRLNSTRDLHRVLAEHNLGVDKKLLEQIYNHCTANNKQDFLLLRMDRPPNERFSKNFLEKIQINEC